MTTTIPPTNDPAFRECVRDAFTDFGLEPIDRFRANTGVAPTVLRRAGTVRPPVDQVETLTLIRGQDGVLRWESGTPALMNPPGLRRGGRAALPAGQVVEQFVFAQIPPNQVGTMLEKLDRKLTPRGLSPAASGAADDRLRRWDGTQLVRFRGADAAGKKVLLFVHGTFSNCDNLFAEMLAAPNQAGKDLLGRAAAHYDFILTFDHPTVGVSPVMNGFDLAALLRPTPASVDVVCHSRGGLVTRWFLEGFADPQMKRRGVLVAATVAGTSLAAPPKQRGAFQYLTNVGETIGRILKLGSAHPFLAAAGTLMSIVTSLTKLAANTPVLDAGVLLFPGLQGQSRVGNNPELLRLRANSGGAGVQYFAITSDFQPRDPGWNFLQYFSRPMLRVANAGADLLFDGPNDLVVDTDAMTDLADQNQLAAGDVLAYGTNESVYHTNYFRQEATLKFIRTHLGIA